VQKKVDSENLEQLLAEADELIQQINSDLLKDVEEEARLEFEKQAENLEKIKSEVREEIDEKGTSGIASSAKGMHEAIDEIIKAMRTIGLR
jgi:ElaB/YqjD/DUF883 family membrane-anchored ribosome-binding protein